MAFTREQYDELKAAIAAGELTVRHNDRNVTYRSLDEMVRIMRMMEGELGINAVSEGVPGRRYASFSKGY